MDDGESSEELGSGAAAEKLLLRVAGGDRDALAELYDRTHGAVYAAALSVLANTYDAEEVTHDTFLRIWDNAGRYRPGGSPMAWMLTIARNLALMELRRRGRRGELSDQEWDAIPADSPRVTAEDRAVLQDALGALEPTERQIVLLHAASGLKHRETAKLLGLPLGTVLSKYNRALRKMRSELEGSEAI